VALRADSESLEVVHDDGVTQVRLRTDRGPMVWNATPSVKAPLVFSDVPNDREGNNGYGTHRSKRPAEAYRRAQRMLPKSPYNALLAGSDHGFTMQVKTAAFIELGFAPHTAGLPPKRQPAQKTKELS
jgi:hypothetical protein